MTFYSFCRERRRECRRSVSYPEFTGLNSSSFYSKPSSSSSSSSSQISIKCWWIAFKNIFALCVKPMQFLIPWNCSRCKGKRCGVRFIFSPRQLWSECKIEHIGILSTCRTERFRFVSRMLLWLWCGERTFEMEKKKRKNACNVCRHAALVPSKVDVLVLKMKKNYNFILSYRESVRRRQLFSVSNRELCLLILDCPIESMCVVSARNVNRNNFFSSRCLGHYLSTTHTSVLRYWNESRPIGANVLVA